MLTTSARKKTRADQRRVQNTYVTDDVDVTSPMMKDHVTFARDLNAQHAHLGSFLSLDDGPVWLGLGNPRLGLGVIRLASVKLG